MTYTEKRFEDYLETVCVEANPSVLDDDMPDFFDAWLGNQDVEDMIRHCNNFLATAIHQAIAEDRERVREGLGEMRKEVVVTKRITIYLGQGNYSTLEDGADILIRNPKMTENEQEQGIGYNQALDDLLSSLDKPLTDK